MKILYAIQGTGNGHVARALEVIPVLQKYADVDIVLSGNQCDIELPWPIKYRFKGAGFIFGKKGGVDIWATLKNLNFAQFLFEIWKIPVHQYDLVLNDFEPVVAWACKTKFKQCIGISHQSAVLHKNAPKPDKSSLFGKGILKYYAPTDKNYGFHFKPLGNTFFTPVIRRDIRYAQPKTDNHYTVYLPAYSDKAIVEFLKQFPETKWEVFSKHNQIAFTYKNIQVNPVNKTGFARSMLSAKGVLCNAGFETPAEALYLNKKLCVIPMLGQYEQQCNAAMLKSMGIPVYHTLNEIPTDEFSSWLQNEQTVKVDYSDKTEQIITDIVSSHLPTKNQPAMAY